MIRQKAWSGLLTRDQTPEVVMILTTSRRAGPHCKVHTGQMLAALIWKSFGVSARTTLDLIANWVPNLQHPCQVSTQDTHLKIQGWDLSLVGMRNLMWQEYLAIIHIIQASLVIHTHKERWRCNLLLNNLPLPPTVGSSLRQITEISCLEIHHPQHHPHHKKVVDSTFQAPHQTMADTAQIPGTTSSDSTALSGLPFAADKQSLLLCPYNHTNRICMVFVELISCKNCGLYCVSEVSSKCPLIFYPEKVRSKLYLTQRLMNDFKQDQCNVGKFWNEGMTRALLMGCYSCSLWIILIILLWCLTVRVW